jgi:nucleoside-diphosphate-sugar epimerase
VPGARILQADARNLEQARAAIQGEHYDAVVDFVAFTPDHIHSDLDLFRNRTEQFVFISSASAYHKPVRHLPITESTPLHNPFWEYSRNKIACEELLLDEYRDRGFPITIVRPSHTYDKTLLPFTSGGTVFKRILADKPVIVHGDGTSLWTLTHHRDFAVGLVGLLGNPKAIGEAFHITSDESVPWNEIFLAMGRAAGKDPQLVHVPSDVIAQADPEWGDGLLGDKAHSVIFDNSKIRAVVPDFNPTIPFHQGAREIVAFHLEHPDFAPLDRDRDALIERLVDRFSVQS